MSEVDIVTEATVSTGQPQLKAAQQAQAAGWLRAAIWIMCALALCSLLGRWLWIGNLACNISAQIIVVIMFLLLFCKRHAVCAAALLSAMTIFSWPWVWDAYQPRLESHDATTGISCMLINPAYWNVDHQRAAEEIIEHDPDVLVIIEAHPDLVKVLRKSNRWNYNYGRSRVGPYSQVILSKLRMNDRKQHVITGTLRTIDSDLDLADQAVRSMLVFEWTMKEHGEGKQAMRFIVAHPPAFTRPRYRHDRQKVFARIRKIIERSKEPCVVIGDLNCTIASYEWRDLAALGMYRAAGPHQRTWGLKTSALRHVGLEIDHICAEKEVRMLPLRYSVISGSDHVAVYTCVTSSAILAKEPSK